MAQDNLKTTPRRYQETPTLQRLPEYGRKKDLETAQGDPSKREPQQNQNEDEDEDEDKQKMLIMWTGMRPSLEQQ